MLTTQDVAAGAIDVKQLLGTWELVSWTRVDASGAVSHPMSDKARGRIIYDASGLMCGFLMDPAHLAEAAAPAKEGHRFLSYTGRYELKGDVVEHDVDMASDPKFVGVILRRRVIPDGERIVLETLAAAGRAAHESTHRLTWRRAV